MLIGIASRLVGFLLAGGGAVSLLQIYGQFRLIDGLDRIFVDLKNSLGLYYTKFADKNPMVGMFFNVGMIVFLSTMIIVGSYRILGLRMGKKTRKYVLFSPFIIILCAVVYMGNVFYFSYNDAVYKNFGKAETREEVAYLKGKLDYDHRKEFKKDNSYVFSCIERNMPEAFYIDLFNSLSFDQRNHHNIRSLKLKGQDGQQDINIPPLMYACYIGNYKAVRAFLLDKKAHIISTLTTKSIMPCSNFFGKLLGRNYADKRIHTCYSIAVENGRLACAELIRKRAQEIGWNGYPGKYISGENRC